MLRKSDPALTKLEETFKDDSQFFMHVHCTRELYDLYKGCKKIDRVMKTDFFNADHFENLVERMKSSNTKMTATRQMNMLRQISRNLPVAESVVIDDRMQNFCKTYFKEFEGQFHVAKEFKEARNSFSVLVINLTFDVSGVFEV